MSEREAFLRAIRENPACDTARLVYADWLDEYGGDPAWATLIRADGHDIFPAFCSVYARFRDQLATQTGLSFLGFSTDPNGGIRPYLRFGWTSPNRPAVPHNVFFYYRRGFVSEVELPAVAFLGGRCTTCEGMGILRHYHPVEIEVLSECPACRGIGEHVGRARNLFAAHPIEAVTLSDKRPWSDVPDGGTDYGWWLETEGRILADGPNDHGNLPAAVFEPIWEANPANRRSDESNRWVVWDEPGIAEVELSASLIRFGRSPACPPDHAEHVQPRITTMTGVTREQLEAMAARAPSRKDIHPGRRAAVDPGDVFARARAYLATIPGAVTGQRGHDRTFYAANRLVRGFALTPDAAYPILAEWNGRCDPPWSEYDLRRKLEQADRQSGPRGFLITADPLPPGAHAKKDGSAAAQFRNYVWDEIPDGETMKRVRRGRRGEDMVDELAGYTGGWPRRVGRMLFATDRHGQILWMKSASELFAWIDWQYGIAGGRGYDWAGGSDCLTPETFLAACRKHCEPWEQVELFPHEPSIPGHYYHHPEIPEGDGRHLDELVRRFSPATDLDGDLIRLLFLSMVWGGPAGKRPIFVIESSSTSSEGGRGAGKTTLASFAASLVGGYLSISPGEQMKDIHARLLSPEGLTRRVGLIDNLKSLRFSNSDLEGLVTSEVISGRQMYTGEGRRPNTLQWIITSNMPSLSKDLAQRSVIIRVTTPTYDPAWQRELIAYVDAHRWKVIGDALAELRSPGKLPDDYRFTRWSEWEMQVLAKAPEAVRLATEVFTRQGMLDDDREAAAEVTDALRGLVERKGFNPERDSVLIPSQVLFDEIVKKFSGVQMSRNSGLRWLYTLGITALRKWDASLPYRGGVWNPDGEKIDGKPKVWHMRFGTDWRTLPD